MEYKVYILRLIDDETPRYVGITSGKLNRRLICHFHDIKRDKCKNLHKKNWLSKYKDSVVIEQIDEAKTISEMKNKEIFYIKKFKECGFNLLNATDGGDGSYGYKHNEETILKISGVNNHMYGKKHTEDWISDAKNRIPHNKGIKTGTTSWNKGIPCSVETKEKIRSTKLGKKDKLETKIKKSLNSKNHLRKRPIECLCDGLWIMYESAKDASIILGLSRSKIVSVCSGYRKTTGGFIFRYLNKNNEI